MNRHWLLFDHAFGKQRPAEIQEERNEERRYRGTDGARYNESQEQ